MSLAVFQLAECAYCDEPEVGVVVRSDDVRELVNDIHVVPVPGESPDRVRAVVVVARRPHDADHVVDNLGKRELAERAQARPGDPEVVVGGVQHRNHLPKRFFAAAASEQDGGLGLDEIVLLRVLPGVPPDTFEQAGYLLALGL
jgi:hypothetical protein